MVENRGKDKIFNIAIMVIMGIYALITLFPLLHVLANSFSSSDFVNKGSVGIWPRGWTFDNYEKVLQETSIWRGYANTLLYTAIGTVIQLVLQFTAAYPLSRKDFRGRTFFSMFFVLTMFIQGGLIPTFLVVKALGMLNTIWAMIIPGCVGVFNIIIIRTYITSTIPNELQEAAQIDGCGNLRIFLSVVIPLCKPILAVMTLYAIVGYWNSYFNSLMYLTDEKLFPLQRVLQGILVSSESSVGGIGGGEQAMIAETLKYVTIVVASAPILLIYPFFEKYFEKGIMIGGVKG